TRANHRRSITTIRADLRLRRPLADSLLAVPSDVDPKRFLREFAMSDCNAQTSSVDLRSARLVHRASIRLRDAGTRSYARRQSYKAFPDATLTPENERAAECLDALRPLFAEDLAHLRTLLNAWGWAVVCRLEGETTSRVICGSHPSALEG